VCSGNKRSFCADHPLSYVTYVTLKVIVTVLPLADSRVSVVRKRCLSAVRCVEEVRPSCPRYWR